MKGSGGGWKDSVERYEREHSFSGNDWYKLFLVLVVLYYVVKIIGAIIE